LRVAAQVDVRDVIKIVVIDGLLHDLLQSLYLLEHLSAASVVGVVHFQGLSEGALEVLVLVQSRKVHVFEGGWGVEGQKSEGRWQQEGRLKGDVGKDRVCH
jgi:hypothetical protein